MTTRRGLALGGVRPLDGSGETRAYQLPVDDLVTHACILGATGSGKTGLIMVLVEEALRSSVPVVMIDVKGDLPNLLLTCPELAPGSLRPGLTRGWRSGRGAHGRRWQLAESWRKKLADFGLGPQDVAALRSKIAPRVLTPGTLAGEPLHVLSCLELPSPLWSTDLEAAREALSASISLLLRLIGRIGICAGSRAIVRRQRYGERPDAAP